MLQVPVADNYFAALNSAVFSDGSFVYVPKGVRSPMELSTYFRINASETGQVERMHRLPHRTNQKFPQTPGLAALILTNLAHVGVHCTSSGYCLL